MKENSSILRHLPNLLTLLNVLLGCLAINKAFERNFIFSATLIFIAAFIDFLDGFLARKLNTTSEFGKALDSLADIVSFGVAPSFMIYQLLTMSLIMNNPTFSLDTLTIVDSIILYSGFLIPVFGAIRLARFNSNNVEKKFFQGLPIPAAGILFASITLLFAQTENEVIRNIIINTPFLLILILGISILMVSKLPLFSLKFEDFSFSKDNQLRYLFISASIVLLVLLQYLGIPLIIILYILLSLITAVFVKK
jgi:CDP-diacylglycerol--serine O-phosphatidyltransferase